MAATSNRRGRKHLRVGLEVGAHGLHIVSMWAVDQPALQQDILRRPLVVRVDIGGQPVLIESFDDPRVNRGVFDPRNQRFGHSYKVEATGIIQVSIPFDNPADLGTAHIRVAEMTAAGRPLDPAALAKLFDGKPHGVHEVSAAKLTAYKDWAKVLTGLGVTTSAGHFEIYVDHAGEFRWRLRRPDGEIVADSGGGYKARAECERDLQWVRDHASTVSIVSTKS